MSQVQNCPICDGIINSAKLIRGYDINGLAIEDYNLWKCAICGVGITSPTPPLSELGQLYSAGVYASEGGKAVKAANLVLNFLQKSRLKVIEKYLRISGRRLLDIGCGKGRFLKVAHEKYWDAVGQEFSDSQAKVASSRAAANVFCKPLTDLRNTGPYDVVTAWHVIEHLTDPLTGITLVNDLLSRDGIFCFEVPNFDSWQAKIGRGQWFQLDIPRHLWHFTPSSLENILTKNNFEILETHTFSVELGPFGMWQTLHNKFSTEKQWIFRYLKRSVETAPLELLYNGIVAVVLFPAAIVLESLAVAFSRGGVLRYTVRRKD